MTSERRRIILVTGSPRSGTTAVGKMLSLGRGVCALHEPLNYHAGLRAVGRYFEIPGTGGFTTADLDRCIHGIRTLQLRFKQGLFPEDRGLRRIAKQLVGGRGLSSYRRCRITPGLHTIVWKDPFACFLAGYLAREHDIDVVVTVRNPWAVAASFRRMRWGFDLPDIFRRLQESGLAGQAAVEINGWDIADHAVNGALLWQAVYGALAAFEDHSERIRFVNLEHVVREPVETYRQLYSFVRLPWNARLAKRIEDSYASRADKVDPRRYKAHDQARDLRQINVYWKQLLSEQERRMVEQIAGELWNRLSCRWAGK